MIQLPIFGTFNVPNFGTITLEQIGVDGIAVGEVGNLDGATGTELQRRGASMNPAVWCGPVTAGLAAHGPIG